MPAAARCGVDIALTGHGCSVTAGINKAPISFGVYVNNLPATIAGQPLDPHLIPSGSNCVGHNHIVKTGSALVYTNRIPMSRIGDGADIGGAVLTGSQNVFIGGPPSSTPLVI